MTTNPFNHFIFVEQSSHFNKANPAAVECEGADASSCKKETCCEAKASCRRLSSCGETVTETCEDVLSSGMCPQVADPHSCSTDAEIASVCRCYCMHVAASPFIKNNGLLCSGKAASCDKETCCKAKTTCDSFSCTGAFPVNKGPGVFCTMTWEREANTAGVYTASCDANTCCGAGTPAPISQGVSGLAAAPPSTVLSGEVTVTVPDAAAFMTDTVAQDAVREGLAEMVSVPVSYVELTITETGGRRLELRRLAGDVKVEYTITIPLQAVAGSPAVDATAVKAALETKTVSDYSKVIEAKVTAAKGASYKVAVTQKTQVKATQTGLGGGSGSVATSGQGVVADGAMRHSDLGFLSVMLALACLSLSQ